MDIWGSKRTYNSYGGSSIYSFVGDLLAVRLGDYGAALDSIELIACLPSRTRKFRPTLERMFDQYHEFLKKLPQVTFRRKSKRIEIIFRSEHFFEDDDEAWKPTAEKCNTAAGEFATALTLIKPKIKTTDDFDVARFLADASLLLAAPIDSMEEWEGLRAKAKEKRQAVRATKSPWELLEIDWSQFHPKSRDILDDPYFWECTGDSAPHGNDTGADLLADYQRWDKRNRKKSPMDFLVNLFVTWGIEPFDWTIIGEETVLKLNQKDPIAMSLCNEGMIALAFAVVKMRASCPSEVVAMTLAALTRTGILVKHSTLSDTIKAEWDVGIVKMQQKLEMVPRLT